MAASYDVTYTILNTNHAKVRLTEIESAGDLSTTGEVTITYREEQKRVTVKSDTETSAHIGEQRWVRSMCTSLPPEKCTGFTITNIGMIASVINTAAESIAFSGRSLLRPLTVDAVFRGCSTVDTHGTILKVIISDTSLFSPPINPTVVAKSELSRYASEKIGSGTMFCFLRQEPDFEEENIILSAGNISEEFRIPERLARKLQQIYRKDIHSNVVSLSYIPRPLLWLLRYKQKNTVEDKAACFTYLVIESSSFILGILEWLPYFWVEEVALLGCKILGHKLNVDLQQGLATVASSLGM